MSVNVELVKLTKHYLWSMKMVEKKTKKQKEQEMEKILAKEMGWSCLPNNHHEWGSLDSFVDMHKEEQENWFEDEDEDWDEDKDFDEDEFIP